jgi:hypothetical protein
MCIKQCRDWHFNIKGLLDIFWGLNFSFHAFDLASASSKMTFRLQCLQSRWGLLNHVVAGTFFRVKCTLGHAFTWATDGEKKRGSRGFGTCLISARGNLVPNTGIVVATCGRIFDSDALKSFLVDVALPQWLVNGIASLADVVHFHNSARWNSLGEWGRTDFHECV